MAPGRLPAPRTDPGGVNRISMSDVSTRQSALGLSAEFPAGHETATGQRAYQEAERQGVASEVEVKEVAAFGLLAEFVREHLDERAFMGGCHESELVERLSLIHISEPTRLGMISYAVF